VRAPGVSRLCTGVYTYIAPLGGLCIVLRCNGWVVLVGLEGRSTLSLCSERALNLAPARSRART